MAIKKIQMIPEGANDYGDVLHPETSADMVLGGTLKELTKALSNTSYTIPQLRNISSGTAEPSGGSNGDIYFKRKV